MIAQAVTELNSKSAHHQINNLLHQVVCREFLAFLYCLREPLLAFHVGKQNVLKGAILSSDNTFSQNFFAFAFNPPHPQQLFLASGIKIPGARKAASPFRYLVKTVNLFPDPRHDRQWARYLT